VYQSADKTYMGSITKHGSGHIRRILVEVAHVVARTKGRSKLKSFFLRIKVWSPEIISRPTGIYAF